MIPYFRFETLSVGFLTIQIWGLFVALGILVGLMICLARAKQLKLKQEAILNLILRIIVASLIGGRILYILTSGQLATYLDEPWLIFAIWQGGMASTGGFLGAAVVLFVFCHSKRPRICGGVEESLDCNFWQYANILAYAFPFGWMIGRLGCFFIHDHPGRLTNSFLGINFTSGTRFDMGLLEILVLLPLAILFLVLSETKKQTNWFALWLLWYYGLSRFLLDFLRAGDVAGADPRFWSLTLAQWGGLVLMILGGLVFLKIKKSGAGRS